MTAFVMFKKQHYLVIFDHLYSLIMKRVRNI